MPDTNSQKVLIIGGGFAGIKAAILLAEDPRFKVSLVTDNDHFRYYPILYRTATGGSAIQSSISIASIFGNKQIDLIIDKAVKLDRERKQVHTESGKNLPYDSLIIAVGVVTNYFGIKGLPQYAYGIKSLDEAEKLKAHIHKQLIDDHRPDLNYVVIGAGPTGLELAGQIPEYIKHVMKLHNIRGRNFHIDLVEAMPRVAPSLPEDASRAIASRLKSLGVKLYLNQKVEAETADALIINGKSIRSHTVIWTAGVTNHPFFKENSFQLSERGKVIVNEYLEAEENIYVLGDNANTKYSGMAQTALYDAINVANNLKSQLNGGNRKTYQPKRPITVIPVGSHWAALIAGRLRIYGILGWALREMADLIAFHDLEPWWKAGNQLLTEFVSEENCPVCAVSQFK